VAGDVSPDVGVGNSGLAAEHRDDRVVDVGRGHPPGSDSEQQVDRLPGAPVQQPRLGRLDGLPGIEGLAEEGVDRLSEHGAGLVGRDIE
jgi:hypothetical protein